MSTRQKMLEKLRARIKRDENTLQRLEEANKEAADRKESQRLLLIGQVILAHLDANASIKEWLCSVLSGANLRPRERRLVADLLIVGKGDETDIKTGE